MGGGPLQVDPEHLAELLDAAGTQDWTELDDAAAADAEPAALVDDLPEVDPDA